MEDADESLGLIQLELFLRTQLGQLKEEKANRMREVLELKAEDKELCGILAMDPYYVSSSVIPTFSQMEALKKHIQDMKVRRFFGRKNRFFVTGKMSIWMPVCYIFESSPNVPVTLMKMIQ